MKTIQLATITALSILTVACGGGSSAPALPATTPTTTEPTVVVEPPTQPAPTPEEPTVVVNPPVQEEPIPPAPAPEEPAVVVDPPAPVEPVVVVDPPAPPALPKLQVTVIDGYMVNAEVSAEGCETGYTNEAGQVELECAEDTDFNGLQVNVDNEYAYDSITGQPIDFPLTATINEAGQVIVSPATTLGKAQKEVVDPYVELDNGNPLPLLQNIHGVLTLKMEWEQPEAIFDALTVSEGPLDFYNKLDAAGIEQDVAVTAVGAFQTMYMVMNHVDADGRLASGATLKQFLVEALSAIQSWSKEAVRDKYWADGYNYLWDKVDVKVPGSDANDQRIEDGLTATGEFIINCAMLVKSSNDLGTFIFVGQVPGCDTDPAALENKMILAELMGWDDAQNVANTGWDSFGVISSAFIDSYRNSYGDQFAKEVIERLGMF